MQTSILRSSPAAAFKDCRPRITRHFAQLVTPIENMINKPESPEPQLVRVHRKRQVLPASWMRSGTSKGLFIQRRYLPPSQDAWSPWILAAMGSKNADPRQLNGIGGATSTTSKVAVVAASSIPGIDVEYTFAQVAVGKEKVDYSGNCGNIASGVGPFALEEGLVYVKPGQEFVDVRILNTNTGSVLVETIAVDEDGLPVENGDYRMAGVADSGSEIKVAFVDPSGPTTGKLFPTGNTQDTITVIASTAFQEPISVQASLVDCANPFIVVDGTTLPTLIQGSPEWLERVEDIRRRGAVMMGLADTEQEAALTRGTPKISIVSPPVSTNSLLPMPDVSVVSMSMGQIHPSVQLTGAVCLAAAACMEGTVPYMYCGQNHWLSEQQKESRRILIAHRSGQIPVDVRMEDRLPERCSVSRTARKLFEGNVLFYS